jgi:hypothetical protein
MSGLWSFRDKSAGEKFLRQYVAERKV